MSLTSTLPCDLDLWQRRLEVLQRLEHSLEESEGAILKMDIGDMDAHTEEQKLLCREWRSLDEAIRRREFAVGGEIQLPLERWRALQAQTARVQAELRQRNRVQAALLRRMRRTVAWLDSLIRNPAATYSLAPGCGTSLTREE